MSVFNRATLAAAYDEILERGLGREQAAAFRQGATLPNVIVQSSSGSSGQKIVRIPRAQEDIQDIFLRTLVPYLQVFSKPPLRIAMLGGASHLEAAEKFNLRETRFESFHLSELERLQEYDPDLISCYPSIARELAGLPEIRLPALRAMKLGGELLLDCDLLHLTRRFGKLEFFEQLGSTEMPAVALGRRVVGQPRRLILQTGRFSFQFQAGQLQAGGEWQPLIVRDNFPRQLFPINAFYDTGDEVRLSDEVVVEVRRRQDPTTAFFPLIIGLLESGAGNLQIDAEKRRITVSRKTQAIPNELDFEGQSYQVVMGEMKRIHPSNKLPFILNYL